MKKKEIAKMQDGKSEFVKKLCAFYKAEIGVLTIKDMVYKVDETGCEWVYVIFGAGQQRFRVDGDNNHGILNDFAHYTRNRREFPWLTEDEQI